MSGKEQRDPGVDQEFEGLPAFIFAGCIGGLLLGLFFDNIPYGLCAGVALAIVVALVSSGRRSGRRRNRRSAGEDS